MSVRATRGPTVVVATGLEGVMGAGPSLGGGLWTGFFRDSLGSSCRTNHSRRVSSETTTPIFASDSAMMRTDVPALRSFKRTARNRSSSSALAIFLALASEMSAANLWASSCGELVFAWVAAGKSWVIGGKSMGNKSVIVGRSQGKHQRSTGENLSAKRLDVGVSLKNRNGHADYPPL